MEEKIDLGPVYLRPITMDDTERIVGWRNSDRVRKNFIFQKPFTVQGHIEWMETKVVSGAGRPADPEGPAVSVGPAVSGEPQGTAEEKIYVLDFRVHATAAQLAGLKQYLNQAGIRFEPVPKK